MAQVHAHQEATTVPEATAVISRGSTAACAGANVDAPTTCANRDEQCGLCGDARAHQRPAVTVVNSTGAPVALRIISRDTPGAFSTQTKQSPAGSNMPSSVITRLAQPSAVAGSVSARTSLGVPSFDDVGLQHHHPPRARRQIHRAAHAGGHLAGHRPVGQVAVGGDLEAAQDRQVDVAAADHRERQRRVEHAAARQHGHRLLAGVDQPAGRPRPRTGRGPCRAGRSPSAASRCRRAGCGWRPRSACRCPG